MRGDAEAISLLNPTAAAAAAAGGGNRLLQIHADSARFRDHEQEIGVEASQFVAEPKMQAPAEDPPWVRCLIRSAAFLFAT